MNPLTPDDLGTSTLVQFSRNNWPNSVHSFLKLMVLFVIKGLDQKPILKIKPRVKNIKVIANLKPITSPRAPMIEGTTAPPTIPVHKIPENDP